jgi:DNA polymerase I
LFTEFRNHTNGIPTIGLLDALAHYGLDSIGTGEKDEMRDLILRGGPWTDDERNAIPTYCESDVAGLARLLPAMLPRRRGSRSIESIAGFYLSFGPESSA